MPRLGVGMPIIAGLSQEAVTTIDDFFFESNASGEVNPMLTTSRTNLIPHSQDFNSSVGSFSYVKINSATVTNNSTTAPDGTNTGALVTKGTNDLVLRAVNIVETGKTYTFSCFVKSSGSGITTVSLDITDESFTTFPLTNDWQRISVTAQVTRTPLATYNFVDMATNGSQGDTFFTWGWQVEENGFISAYIPTSGSTVTVSTTLNDTSEVWDFDGTDLTLEADPEDEGFWEEGSNLVLNHDYEDLGSELITNGDYSNGLTGWTKSTSASSSNSSLSVNTNNQLVISSGAGGVTSYGIAVQELATPLVAGKVYKVKIDILSVTGGSGASKIRVGTTSSSAASSGMVNIINNDSSFLGTGNVIYFTPTSNDSHIAIGARDDITEMIVDNVSVKQVDPNDRWTLGTGWSIEDGKAIGTSTTNNLQQLSILTAGDTYELTFTISDYSAGSVRANVGGVHGTLRSSNGTFTQIIGPATSPHFFFDGVSTFTGKIDNVTVREYAVQPKDI